MSRARRGILPLFIPHLGCPHDCVFCAQRRISGQMKPVTPADVAAALDALDAPVEEIAFYGGSFTALPEAEQAALLSAAKPALDAGMARSIRVSTRPDAIAAPGLDLLAAYGVTTVELGAQSMDDGVLAAAGRGHRASDTVRASELLRRRGFSLILQMMTGLPGSSPALDLDTGRKIAALAPDGVRIYPTVILRGTRLYDLWKSGHYREHTVEDAVAVCGALLPIFDAADIPVIRLGLNPTEELSQSDSVAGGAYHPALGELVKSRVLLNRARTLLSNLGPVRTAVLGVNPSQVSQMIGQHRRNLAALREEFDLSQVRVVPAPLPKREVKVIEWS